MLKDVLAIFLMFQKGFELQEEKEVFSFLKYHNRFKGILEESYIFQTLKINLDENLPISDKVINSFDVFISNINDEDVELVGTKLEFIATTISMIFDLNTRTARTTPLQLAIIINKIKEYFTKAFNQSKENAIKDIDFYQEITVIPSVIFPPLSFSPPF